MSLIGVIASSDKSVPNAPTIGTATNVGTGRAFNNGRADVTFTAPTYTGRLPITSYTVTSSPGGFTGTGAASPISVTGLQSATAYTFTVTATNSVGNSAASAASNSITATTVPQAPTIGTATAGNAQATVTFTGNATGGSAITTYTATSSPGGFTGTSATSPITVTGLTNGTAYTFTVTATNANGTSAASAASNSITPVAPIYWVSQSTNTSLAKTRIRSDATNTRNIVMSASGNPVYIAPLSNTGTVSAGKSVPSTIQWKSGASFVDSSGNIYLAGYRSSDNNALYIFKFNSSLVLQWQRQWTLNNSIYATSMTVDSSGDVYVWCFGTVSGANQGILIKYLSNGTLSWSRVVQNLQPGAFGESYVVHWTGSNVIVTGAVPYNYDGSDYYYYYYWLPVATDGTFSAGYRTTTVPIGEEQTFNGTRMAGTTGVQYRFVNYNTNSTTVNYALDAFGANFFWSSNVTDSSNNVYYVGQTPGGFANIVKVNSSGSVVWQRALSSTSASLNFDRVSIGQGGQIMIGINYQASGLPISQPLTMISLNPDGSGTGTFSVNGRSFTYTASSLTINSISLPIVATFSGSIVSASGTSTTSSVTISDYTITTLVTGIS